MSISLRKRLVGTLMVLTLLAWVGSALLTGLYASRVMMDQVDRQLAQYADLVGYITKVFARQIDQGLPVSEPLLQRAFEGHGHPHVVSGEMEAEFAPALNIWMGERMLALLENSPQFPRPRAEGFSVLDQDSEGGKHWRILARYDEDNDLWILVGIELDAARWAMFGILGQAAFPLLIILPLTVVLLYFGVTRGLRPVRALAAQISHRSPTALDPVSASEVPEEMAPVVAELNELLERLATALEGEQRFTANAAHELMTPLAAIKTEVQVCQRQAEDERGRAMLQRIALRVDRASHTVQQLLTLARLDPDAPLPMTEFDLDALLGEVVAETAHLAADRHIEVELDAATGTRVNASHEALAILLRNLLINAFRYASEASAVRVTLAPREAGLQLEICNDCEPLSAEEFAHIGDRFYRVPGSAGLGAGLGLSIVNRIASHHNGEFSVGPGPDGSGFCARLSL